MAEDGYDDWVTLEQYHRSAEAQMVRIRLESEGIECLILDELSTTIRPHYAFATGGIRLQVRRHALSEAAKIIGTERDRQGRTRHHCPECQSHEVYSRDFMIPRFFIMLPLFALCVICFPLGLMAIVFYRMPMRCRACGYKWRLPTNFHQWRLWD